MAFLQEIYVADDHEAVWLGVRVALASSEFSVIGQCRDHDEVLVRLAEHVPDALITDFAMPGHAFPDGLGYLQHLTHTYPGLPVMVLTMTRRPVLIQAMRDSGALAVVDKSASLRTLPALLRRIIAGHPYISPSFVALVDRALPRTDKRRLLGDAHLTSREKQVLSLLGKGHTLTEIGRMFGRSLSTVSTMKRRAMAKLGLSSTHDILDYIHRQGRGSGTPE